MWRLPTDNVLTDRPLYILYQGVQCPILRVQFPVDPRSGELASDLGAVAAWAPNGDEIDIHGGVQGWYADISVNPSGIAAPSKGGCVPMLLAWLLLFTLAARVQAQFSYLTNNGSITITGYTGPGGALLIPDLINDLSVTRIGERAFQRPSGLPAVTYLGAFTSLMGLSLWDEVQREPAVSPRDAKLPAV
jgi:hypothetical protein